jgi:hypothetical protein
MVWAYRVGKIRSKTEAWSTQLSDTISQTVPDFVVDPEAATLIYEEFFLIRHPDCFGLRNLLFERHPVQEIFNSELSRQSLVTVGRLVVSYFALRTGV